MKPLKEKTWLPIPVTLGSEPSKKGQHMSNIIETGGPAFPSGLIDPSVPEEAIHPMHKGMSIRDYFAAKAMQALSNGEWPDARDSLLIAERAYAMADAMLKARSQS
jgi:hypothetical protein